MEPERNLDLLKLGPGGVYMHAPVAMTISKAKRSMSRATDDR